LVGSQGEINDHIIASRRQFHGNILQCPTLKTANFIMNGKVL
jgi:hypothetical protein